MRPGVHTELWLDGYRISAGNDTYGANGESLGCVNVWWVGDRLVQEDYASGWHVVDVPISDAPKAWEFIRAAVDARVSYGVSVGECAFPKFIIDAFDSDLDCCRPETWNRLFCSQFVLLFLRWCAVCKILMVPDERAIVLWSVNSRGCLPSRLQAIADSVLSGTTL